MINKAKFEAYAQQNCSPADFPLGSLESRARARALLDSGAAGRLWKDFIRDLNDAANAELEESRRRWSATEPDKRRFLPQGPGPINRAFRELGEAMKADGWMTGEGSSGRAVEDWFDKHFGKDEGEDSDSGATI